jgi:hypothetical protein
MGRRNPFILQNKEIPGSSQDPYFIPNILKILVHPEVVGTVGTFSNGGFPKLIGTPNNEAFLAVQPQSIPSGGLQR